MLTAPKWDFEPSLMKISHFCNYTSLPRKLDSLERSNFSNLLEFELEKFTQETFVEHISSFPTHQKSKESIKNWESYGQNTEDEKQGNCQATCSLRTGTLPACRSWDQPAPVLPLHPARFHGLWPALRSPTNRPRFPCTLNPKISYILTSKLV